MNYIREKDWAPEDPRIHPVWSTPKCWMKTWRNRDGPRSVSHTAEWTGLSGLSKLTPQGRGRRQRGLDFFFPWMVNTGVLGTQEKELGGGDRRGTWLHKVGLELVGHKERESSRMPATQRGGRGGPLEGEWEWWADLRTLCREGLRRPGLAGLSEEPLQQSYRTQAIKEAEGRAQRKGGRNCSRVVRPRKLKIVRWELEGAGRNRAVLGVKGS